MGQYDEYAGKLATSMKYAEAAVSIDSRQNIIKNLSIQEQELTLRINKIKTLKTILEKNPDIVEILNLTRELL